MTIRAMWNFNHLPPGTTAGVSGFGLNSYGIGFAASGFEQPVPVVLADGKLQMKHGASSSAGSTHQSYIQIASSAITDGASKKSFIGLRLTETSGYTTWRVLPAGMTIKDLLVIQRDDPVLPPAYTSFYLEVGIDRVNKSVDIYVDGTLVKTMTDANAIAICNSYTGANLWRWGWLPLPGYGDNYQGIVSDIYFSDEVDGEATSARLGPVTLIPLTLDTATGSNWTSSDSAKTITAAMNTAVTNAATLPAPVATSPTPTTPLELKFTAGMVDETDVKAVQFLFDARRVTAESTPTLSINYNNANTALTPPVLNGTVMAYGLPSSISTKAPDNTSWQIGKLKAAKLTLSTTG